MNLSACLARDMGICSLSLCSSSKGKWDRFCESLCSSTQGRWDRFHESLFVKRKWDRFHESLCLSRESGIDSMSLSVCQEKVGYIP